MIDLHDRIAALSPDQRAALAERLAQRNVHADQLDLLLKQRKSHYPLSFAQQRMWLLEQLQGPSPTYLILTALDWRGPLDHEALHASLETLVARHVGLRTRFTLDADGAPRQEILDDLHYHLERQDFSQDAASCSAVDRHMANEAARGFDLTQGPPFKILLYRLGDDRWRLLFKVHHIIFDGWSEGILLAELTRSYAATIAGRRLTLPDPTIQYGQYAEWERHQRRQGRFENALTYWRGQLADVAPLALPHDGLRRPRPTRPGRTYAFTLAPHLTRDLNTFAQTQGATLFMVLLAGFKALLARVGGGDDIAVGTPIANRRRADCESVIGLFVNTLVLRTRLDERATFRELVARVRQTTLAGLNHGAVPFDHLVEALRPQRDPSRSPFFDVFFALQSMPIEPFHLEGVQLTPREVEPDTTANDLTLLLHPIGEGVRVRCKYDADLFSQSRIDQMMHHYRHLLEQAVRNPEIALSSLPLPGGAESVIRGDTWTGADGQSPQPVHRDFEARVRSTPDHPAVCTERETWSYTHLNAEADRIADRIRQAGIRPEARVAVCMPRCPHLVASVLGILKAGACYLPIDPEQPPSRRTAILAESGAVLALVDDEARISHPGAAHFQVMVVQAGPEPAQSQAAPANCVLPIHGDQLAYTIFTSGSTGRPRGVMITHQALARQVAWTRRTLGVGPDDRMLQQVPTSFDPSLIDLFVPLTSGATIVLARAGGQRDLQYLKGILASQRISLVQITPSAISILLELNAFHQQPRLRALIAGGEPLPPSVVNGVQRQSRGRIAMFNCYGPTEATITATFWRCPRTEPVSRTFIGVPVDGMQALILDASLQPVPRGAGGELYLAGPQLMRGYLNAPARTADRLRPHPFSKQPGARMYRTGDRARLSPDGHLNFLGRLDRQAKIRGFRIETGEVERAIQDAVPVRGCRVLVRGEGQSAQLTAFLATAGKPPDIAELRHRLGERLPTYMIPTSFAFLDTLPTLPSGKVDESALPSTAGVPEFRLQPPGSTLERQVAAIWKKHLGLEEIGVNANFFDCGGHSLLLVRIQKELQDLHGREIPLIHLFERPTIQALCQYLERKPETPTAPPSLDRRVAHQRGRRAQRQARARIPAR
ncbi:Amino acid adenylation domain-containing protein [Sulfidibacter corallicola]|uniref:Amino acid adenylation domain-containing protein n=1 Tax=Sulfidibacter corallicola TaxID=2818388 RepID=A0A8A4TKH1_SULCO|nr:amino acid adenylation domain-containing protein [Sulfidibacter corallicola]QTD50040.1 amino acid adenylation domain-containing protein [Sulfidibacter corallicola]